MRPANLRMVRIATRCVMLAAMAIVMLTTGHAEPAPASPARAPYEPPDASTYHGVCLPGYWKDEEFAANVERYRTDRPLVLHS